MASDEIGAPCPAPSSTDPDASQHVQHVATLVPPGNAELFPRSVYQDLGCDVAFATSITEMRTIVETGSVDVCILPLDLNGHSVLPLIHDLLKQNKDQPVIVFPEVIRSMTQQRPCGWGRRIASSSPSPNSVSKKPYPTC